ncbi:MAG: response regulator transcription factor [Planctomycetes bacterium]|nr:response regulator transcription factor [Planctomycetota bacterium]
MHVLYLTKDIFFSSRVCSFAREAGATIDVVASLQACQGKADTSLVIIDLGLAQLDIALAVRRLRELSGELNIIAYGPHVDAAMLTAAEQAGCDAVLPRSQFDQQIAAILRNSMSSQADTE